MKCKRCVSERVFGVQAELAGPCTITNLTTGQESEHDDEDVFVPTCWPIGSDNFIEFSVCGDCGQVDGEFPVPDSAFGMKLKKD